MTSAEVLKSAILGVCQQLQQDADGAIAAAQQAYSQAASSFASLTQGMANPKAEEIAVMLGAASKQATDLLGGNTALEGEFRAFVESI